MPTINYNKPSRGELGDSAHGTREGQTQRCKKWHRNAEKIILLMESVKE